jgi:hypothetical protein
MARLIPRKQIEEQQDISGSLTVRQDLIVGGSIFSSGSIQIDNDFFLGDSLNDKGEITGSVFVTGSMTIDGNFSIVGDNTLNVTASKSQLAIDTERYAGILAKDFGANLPTLYVSSTDGDDNNDGRSIQYPLRTIKRAAALSQPGYDGRYGFDTGSIYNGYVIKVQAGTYLEDNPVILPKNTTIWGAGLRITKINAKNPTEDLFWVNSGCYVAEVTVGGLRLYPDQINPEKGFGFAFQPGAFITTSPYIQNCSQISNQENSFTELYEDIPPGGGGLYVNGDVINSDSPLASMVLDAYTQISPNGVGCLVNGRGFIQLVSFFNNFSYYAIRVNNGGHATLNNSNISFGLYGMYASGSRLISGSGGFIEGRDKVRQGWSVVVDVLNKGLDGLPDVTTLNTVEGIRVVPTSVATQYYLSGSNAASADVAAEVVADYNLVSEIVQNGVDNYPTLLAKSSIKGYGFTSPYNILGATQITSSQSASLENLNHISASYAALLSIFSDGTGSYIYTSSNEYKIKISDNNPEYPTLVASNAITGSVSSSFSTVISILKTGLTQIPTLVTNTNSYIYRTAAPFSTGISSSLSTINEVSASFSTIYNIIARGTGSNIETIPNNHQQEFTVTNTNSSSYKFIDSEDSTIGENPTIKLFRGLTYKFYISASAAVGGIDYPFWIRTAKVDGIDSRYDYNKGVINNGDSVGTITFTVPYDAPNDLYYVASTNDTLGGAFSVVNSSTTPRYLIENTLTYPETISGSLTPSENTDIINAYEILTGSKSFIQNEVINYISSSWSEFYYNQETCKRDVGYIIDAVALDLLYGGNDRSITAGRFYYEIPSQATNTQKSQTLDGVKYAARLSENLLKNKTFVEPSIAVLDSVEAITGSKQFIKDEVITFLSSSWSNFDYNEASCSRDVGYILDAVTTDLLYGGNERSIEAGTFYYLYPSQATGYQLDQTTTAIKYAYGLVDNIIKKNTLVLPSTSSKAAYNLLKQNKELIQNETIQFINVAYPQLTYNESKCRRDVGYIVDAVATDLLYGGNERSITAGRYYYDYPSVATSIQKRETIGGIKYAKIIGDYIAQNILLDTPRIITNVEKGIKITNQIHYSSSFSGSITEQNSISSSFSIIEGVIKRGPNNVNSVLAQHNNQNWSLTNPINISGGTQITSTTSSANLTSSLESKFGIVTTIINSGSSYYPAISSSYSSSIKVTNNGQYTGSVATSVEATAISSSFALVSRIISNGTGSLPSIVLNTSASIKVTNATQYSGSGATDTQSSLVSSSFSIVTKIIEGGLGVVPTMVLNSAGNVKVTSTPQYISSSFSGSNVEALLVSQSISLVCDIISGVNQYTNSLSLPTSSYVVASNDINVYYAYNLLKQNINFIKDETIAYLSASWYGFSYDQEKCKRDVGLIVSGAAEDLLFGSLSASLVNGRFYLEYPSAATGSQLNQTIDGIKFASKLAQKVIKNTQLSLPTFDVLNASNLLFENRHFVQSESIAYLSSSWGEFEYNDQTCKRDIGHIIDAARTDLIYGGNERAITAGKYYFLYPSAATGSQLIQTLDGINYASKVSQKVVKNIIFETASINKRNASFLLEKNKNFIANEVVAYVSSSWSTVYYNEAKCKRDVKYIIDAVRTDLVYGGNERSITAGKFYYIYPSSATIGGVPSATNQLDPTITGIHYGSGLSQKIVLGDVFVTASNEAKNVNNLLKQNRSLIRTETIEYIRAFYPYLLYNEASCSRDVGFILDSVGTDILYGGNERSAASGLYYYKFPSLATTSAQKKETIDAINYVKEVAKRVVTNDVLDTVTFETNTTNNIKVGNVAQYTSSYSASQSQISNVSSSFSLVTQIIEGGLDVIPTKVTNTNAAIKVTSEIIVSSSISASNLEVGKTTSSFNLIRDIIYNGSASLPDSLVSNFNYGFELIPPTLWHISSITQSLGSGTYNTQVSNVSSSYANIINIVNNGTASLQTLVANASSSIKTTSAVYNQLGSGSTNEVNRIVNLYNIVLDIIEDGITKIPTLISNTSASIKVTTTPQIISGSGAQRLQAKLISSSFALVVDLLQNNGTSSIEYIPTSSANTNSKVTSAYNLLLDNKQMIIDETISYMSSSWSTFVYDQSKCERDLGLIISGAAFDLIYGSNSASLVNGKYYFESASAATGSQLDQTITAIKYASGISEKVVQNIVLQHISSSLLQPASSSWSALRANKHFIQSESIAYLSSSWQGFDYNETTCKRDIGYIVDAVATDLLYGGNERSLVAGRYYYDYPSQATDSQLEPTLTGVRYAKGLSRMIVSGSSFVSPDSNNQYAYNLVKNNKTFIQEETVAFVNAKWPDLDYIESKCKRDVGYIVDAVATDLLYGGNERSNKAGEFYYLYPSLAITSEQKSETTQAIDYARRLTGEIINSNLISTPQVIPNGSASTDPNVLATYDLLINNKPFIQAETIAYVSSSWVGFQYNEASCSRDVGFIIDAVATDILYSGNESSANAGIVYFLTASAATGSQLEQTVSAIDFAKGLAVNVIQNIQFTTASQSVSASVELLRRNREFIQEETMQYLTASWSTFDYNKEKCRRDVGHIVDGVATDLLYGGNERSIESGEFYYKYPSQATTTQLRQTNEAIDFASRISQKIIQNIVFQTASLEVSASFDLLRKNKPLIQAETIAYVSSSWSTVYYNEASCSRDVGYLIDAAATDLLYGGKERSVTAGLYYYYFPSKATVAGVPSESNQLDPTITGVKYAGRLSTKIITNPTFTSPTSSYLNGRELLSLNKNFIQKETITFLSSSWSTLKYNEVSCSRDIGFIIDAIKTDLVYGGNERSIEAGSYYYKIPSVAIKPSYTDNGTIGQKNQTVDGINYAKGVSEKIVLQTQLTFATQRRRQSVERLRGAKDELKQRAISYTNGAFPYLIYNEASCSRDTGLIVDAVATDLLYGGNERSVAAASSYFNGQFGNAGEVIFKQRLETLETNRYLRTRAEFIAAGASLEPFGSLIVATGIDYSYNGSGVTFKALPPNQGGSGAANPAFEITELGGGRIFFTSGNQDGDFRIGTGLSINQATGTLVGRTFSKSLFSLVTPFSLALQI